jgi:2-deoxy-D-gluconate 3-dehydrogenase
MTHVLDLFKLNRKVAIVTGASRGLGQGMALALAEAGADIVAVDVLPVDDTVAEVARLGRKAVAVVGDLADRAFIARVVAEARRSFDSLDILVNCAGIIRRQDFLGFSEADWDDVIDINMNAVFFLTQSFCNDVIARGGKGKVVNIASMLSFQGGIRVPSYTASKSAA